MASTLISNADVVEHLETDLDATDPALETLINSADAAIKSLYGPHVDGERTVRMSSTRTHKIFLPYPPADTVAEIQEYSERELATDAETVPDDEYELDNGGTGVRRPTKVFNDRVIVRYTPVDDSAERTHILVDLVKLSEQYEAVKLEELGTRGSGISAEYLDYTREYNLILNRMRTFAPGQMFV